MLITFCITIFITISITFLLQFFSCESGPCKAAMPTCDVKRLEDEYHKELVPGGSGRVFPQQDDPQGPHQGHALAHREHDVDTPGRQIFYS